ncbi:MAG: cob(I)yrinic acid a,c-diamide adenosyltransferase [Bacteroidales bacterium]|nr:cob(I)yrinic acid a,c-diamide adenosyltransferase [Bacteroidales bacterium]MBR5703689.1 cob(I)yrinic acid a,c-diamide adenosyltransferase [Bacteroidales bacterium]
MKRIYTRTGDGGTTGIHGGKRVAKDDIRIEANGALDELNCHIGLIRSVMPAEAGIALDAILQSIQSNLMAVMSLVATPSAERESNPNQLPDNLVEETEAAIDSLTAQAGESGHFLLPGGTPLAAHLQVARAVCRRAERRLWTLNREDPVPESVIRYINRLSDLLFVMARIELQRSGFEEERWKAFNYKNKAK